MLTVSLTVSDLLFAHDRFQGLNGQVSEFQLKPDWALPVQEEPEEWDINPATEDLPLDQVLSDAAAVRREHLEGAATAMPLPCCQRCQSCVCSQIFQAQSYRCKCTVESAARSTIACCQTSSTGNLYVLCSTSICMQHCVRLRHMHIRSDDCKGASCVCTHTDALTCILSCAELEEQKEAKARREASPWGDRLDPHADYTMASPSSLGYQEEEDMDMEQGPSPSEGATGYYETGEHSAFQFEPPRAPAHYGASRNSPGASEDPYRAGSHNPWGAAAGMQHAT